MEIIQKLLENELLSESTRAEISEHWQAFEATYKQELRESVQAEVRAELAESWVSERDQLIHKLDGFLSEALTGELSELQADIERFRDHETAQAGKIVEMRKSMAVQVAEEMDSLVDKLDTFLEQRIESEFAELREDLEIAKQNDFGRKIFEAYESMYTKGFVHAGSVQAKLNVAESKLASVRRQLKSAEAEKTRIIRESKMSSVLSSLTGAAREQMSFILKNVPTEKLDESYKAFLPRVLRESAEPAPAVITESAKPTTALKTGDAVTQPAESADKPQLSESILLQQRMAGIIK